MLNFFNSYNIYDFFEKQNAKLGQNFTIDYQANANLTFFNVLDNIKSFYEILKNQIFWF